jgi:hypothetical protein
MYCDLKDGEWLVNSGGDTLYQFMGCECSCDAMVNIQKPNVGITALSFVAQSLVVSIIGLNMGFRCGTTPFTCCYGFTVLKVVQLTADRFAIFRFGISIFCIRATTTAAHQTSACGQNSCAAQN